MNTITVSDIFSDENVKMAFDHLRAKPNSKGYDGVRLSDLKEYWDLNSVHIMEQIYSHSYQAGLITIKEIVQKSGKKREVAMLCAVDRLITRCITQLLSVEIDKTLSNHSYAYRAEIGSRDAAKYAASCMEKGLVWVCEIDIKDFFGSISHEKLYGCLENSILDEDLRILIESYVDCRIESDGDIIDLKKGLIQGSPLSPLLSNLFLDQMDKNFEKEGLFFYRYSDDINIYTRTKEDAAKAFKKAEQQLETLDLRINKTKGGIHKGINRKCLGYEFVEEGRHVLVQRAHHKTGQPFRRWQRTAIQKLDNTYHLVSDGVLTRKDFTILFENEEGKYYLPVEAMDALNIYSNVAFSGTFFEFVNQEKLIVNLVDASGEKVGTFLPVSLRRDYRTEMAQVDFRNHEKTRLPIAKKYQNANVFNLRAVLRYYARRGREEEFKEEIDYMTSILQKMNEARDINALLMYEAQARQKYYQCFNKIIAGESFTYTGRSRRPPKDALNAMISFGNTILYQRFAMYIYRSSLDIRFGILHNSYNRSESLNLDLADLFKPVLVDRTIFTLANRKMIDEEGDFEFVENGGVYLNKHGKSIFLREFEKKLHQRLKIKNTTKTYDVLMREEVCKLEKFFRKNEPYRPYKYVN